MTEIKPQTDLPPRAAFCLRLAQQTSLSIGDIAKRCRIGKSTAYQYIREYLGPGYITERNAQISMGELKDTLTEEAVKEIEKSLMPVSSPAATLPQKLGGFEVMEVKQVGNKKALPRVQGCKQASPAAGVALSVNGVRLEFDKADSQTAGFLAKLICCLKEGA